MPRQPVKRPPVRRRPPPRPVPAVIAPPTVTSELTDVAEDAMDGPDPRPLIDRRHVPRVAFAARAALAPADATAAARPPAIRTRDLNPFGLGFTARQDLSVLGDAAVLQLPGDNGRLVCVACRVRRSRELGNGWYDGLAEFVTPQPLLTVKDGHARLPHPLRRRR